MFDRIRKIRPATTALVGLTALALAAPLLVAAPSRRDASAVATAVPRCVVLIVDDANIPQAGRLETMKLLESVRGEILRPTDLLAVESTGFSSVGMDVSNVDKLGPRFDQALRKISDAIDHAPSASQGAAASPFYTTHVGLEIAREMLEKVAAVDAAPKVLLYVRGTYAFDPFVAIDTQHREGRALSPIVTWASRPADITEDTLTKELGAVFALSGRVHASFITMEPLGMRSWSADGTNARVTRIDDGGA